MAKYRGEVFMGANGDWYWKLVAKNGNIVGNGGEGYKNRNVAIKMLENIVSLSSDPDFQINFEETESEKLKAEKKLAKMQAQLVKKNAKLVK